MGGSLDSWNWTIGSTRLAADHHRCRSSKDGMSSLHCNDEVSAERSWRPLKHVRVPWDIMRLPATRSFRTPTASPLIGRWGTRKSSGSLVSVDRYATRNFGLQPT